MPRFIANVEIDVGKKNDALYHALKPDITSNTLSNAEIMLREIVEINIESDDISQLRAMLNSYLRLVSTAIECLEIDTIRI